MAPLTTGRCRRRFLSSGWKFLRWEGDQRPRSPGGQVCLAPPGRGGRGGAADPGRCGALPPGGALVPLRAAQEQSSERPRSPRPQPGAALGWARSAVSEVPARTEVSSEAASVPGTRLPERSLPERPGGERARLLGRAPVPVPPAALPPGLPHPPAGSRGRCGGHGPSHRSACRSGAGPERPRLCGQRPPAGDEPQIPGRECPAPRPGRSG